MDDFGDFFYAAVQEHLETAYDYDFIHEVFAVEEVRSEDPEHCSVRIGYRGVHGEYGTLSFEGVTAAEFLAAAL